ncbi:DoxX family protein [Flavobacterium sp. CYK-4]|uniref:DoxX family protein n=1 Tax=Flavobacterium lotistagni TaxID=2709660 RepID=UPI0014086AB2|nr:DoxX family protein [Flavobacterium lotistagni]NHM07590.1 DoxX family protein [Flavobacterium lotistagni]
MNQKTISEDSGQLHEGLLIIRILIGITFIIHGFPKLTGGIETWTFLGGTMKIVAIDFMPAFWGFLCAIAEFLGGIFLALGLFTRISAAALLLTMLMATLFHLTNGDSFDTASHAIEDGILFLGFIYMGAGKYSLDYRMSQK